MDIHTPITYGTNELQCLHFLQLHIAFCLLPFVVQVSDYGGSFLGPFTSGILTIYLIIITVKFTYFCLVSGVLVGKVGGKVMQLFILTESKPKEFLNNKSMESSNTSGDFSNEMEVDAFRGLFPLQFYERHLVESIRPDGRPLGQARDTTVALGAVGSAAGSALVKIGCTTMLAAIKLEVMTPSRESPDEGNLAVEFHMPPICSPLVRPGRPAEAAPVISKQLSDTITSSGMIDLKELSLVSGKAAWMAYLDIYCLDADGALFDAALLSAVSAFSHLRIPVVSLNDEGRVVIVSEEEAEEEPKKEPVNKQKRKLTLNSIPFSLTCILHKNYVIADPTSEEESIVETSMTVVLNPSGQLVSLYKPGGSVLAYTAAIQDCVALARQRVKELQKILKDTISDMEVD